MAPLHEIRKLLHRSTPAISQANWEKLRCVGWRWERNLPLSDLPGATDHITALQHTHGDERVAVGTALDDEKAVATPLTSQFGIYIWEDADELAEKLQEELNDLAALEAWLTDKE